jgi:hypothetical protein
MRKKVKAKWGINVPGKAEFLVKSGEQVNEGQVLAKFGNKKINSFDFSGFLGKINSQKLLELNEKFKDSWVGNGELICMVVEFFLIKFVSDGREVFRFR